ncbi:hypothetical protein MUN86_10030 [Hymenobacter volaticus]|uniref:Uncharacterized protein n=1 Tax=Hymenobacter volaticus TaxID=2932254 RepID=A0ABY4GBK9_9BACT|nr:hypothetical protein MUN86_10030 [Hymenobacter volaticus]
MAALSLHAYLELQGIQALLTTNAQQPTVPQVAFCLRADHSPADIAHLTQALLAWATKNSFPFSIPNVSLRHETQHAVYT